MAQVIANAQPQTLTLHALRGRFDGVTYFMTSMRLSECSDQLHFASSDEVKPFRERVQRSIDTDRAQQIFEDYLCKQQIRIFNSLVVVLMPKAHTKTGYFEFEPFALSNGQQLEVGTLRVLSDIDRIVVDGQHRLYALKKANDYVREPAYDNSVGLHDLQVPVVFLTFNDVDGQGFSKPFPQIVAEVSDRARKVFIDLNKNAVKADKNTLYVLDDHDFSAVAAREVIEAHPHFDHYTRWHGSGTTLAEADYCFTTIEILNDFVARLFEKNDREQEITRTFDLARDEERTRALTENFRSPAAEWDGQIPEKMLLAFFSRLSFFADWMRQVEAVLPGKPPLQPKEISLNTEQRKQIRDLRKGPLLATVAGQKAAIMALLEGHAHLTNDKAEDNYNEALKRLDQAHKLGIYSRDNRLWDELLTRHGGKMNLRNVKESARVLEFLIRLEPVESIETYINASAIAEGVGTADTAKQYAVALGQLKRALGIK